MTAMRRTSYLAPGITTKQLSTIKYEEEEEEEEEEEREEDEVEVEQSLTPHPTQYRSFRRRSSQPIT